MISAFLPRLIMLQSAEGRRRACLDLVPPSNHIKSLGLAVFCQGRRAQPDSAKVNDWMVLLIPRVREDHGVK